MYFGYFLQNKINKTKQNQHNQRFYYENFVI